MLGSVPTRAVEQVGEVTPARVGAAKMGQVGREVGRGVGVAHQLLDGLEQWRASRLPGG